MTIRDLHFSTLGGKMAASLAIYQLPGANSLDVASKITETMERLAQDFPEGLALVDSSSLDVGGESQGRGHLSPKQVSHHPHRPGRGWALGPAGPLAGARRPVASRLPAHPR